MPQVLVNNVYFCWKERAALQLKHSVSVPACAIHDHRDSDHFLAKALVKNDQRSPGDQTSELDKVITGIHLITKS